MVHPRVHSIPPPDPNLSQMNPLHTSNIMFLPRASLFRSGLPTLEFSVHFSSPVRAAYRAYLTFLDFATVMIRNKENTDPNILLGTCSQTPPVYVHPCGREIKFHTHTKQ
jgi:hypothetical protein